MKKLCLKAIAFDKQLLQKLIIMSKLCLLFFVCSVFTLHAGNTYSQQVKLNLDMKNASLNDVISAIKNQTEFEFAYDSSLETLVLKKVAISAKNEKIERVMASILEGTDINFRVFDKIILLSKNAVKTTNGLESSIYVQQQTIVGKITDASTQEPMPGVNIVIEGTTLGTVSDVDGKYSIDIPAQDAVLIFSFVGYNSERIQISGQTTLDIALIPDIKNLNEIVVVGYGTQKRINLTGAISTVDERTLESRPITNVTQGLQGMVPGLNITQSGELAGSLENRPSINVRGVATIGRGSSGNPLILIDGMEGDINTVNSNDIESISVLKDAAASSIYGSRAPFGVILVTTKKGKSGKMQISYSNNFRISSPVLLPDQMDSYSFVNYINLGRRNNGESNFFSDERVQRILDFQQGKLGKNTIPANGNTWGDGYSYGNDNVDWFKEVYRSSAPAQEHSLNVSGGTDRITYYLSGDYMDMDGLMKLNQDSYQRYVLNAKVNAKLSKWAQLSYMARYTREDYIRPSALKKSLYENMARQAWPVLPFKDPNGYLYSSPSPALALQDGGRDKGQKDVNYQQLNLTLEPISNWKIFANLNYKIEDNFRHWDILPTYNHDVNGNAYLAPQGWYIGDISQAHEESSRNNYFSPNVYTEYSQSFGSHNFKVMAGFQSELNKYRNVSATRNGIQIPEYPYIDLTAGTDDRGKVVPPSVAGKYEDWSTSGVFGRLNYDFDGRYLVEANLRYDGTSRFRSDKRWNLFPSASVGWNISRENFWKPIENVVNNFKLRASYGDLGNQNTTDLYPTYQIMNFVPAGGDWLINGARPNKSWNPALISTSMTWERVKTWNAGLDMSLLNNRFSFSFDRFVRFTNDMIGPAPKLPAILGTEVPKTNNTDLETKGFELSLAWQDRIENGFGYRVNLILSDSRTKITKYPNPTGELPSATETDPNKFIYYKGQMIGEIWGYTSKGIAKTDQEMTDHLASLPNGGQNAQGSNWAAGDMMYEDTNKDGKIDNGSNTLDNPGDFSVIGNSTPRYLFGIDLNADWKGVDLRIFFQGVMKRDYYTNSPMFYGASGAGIWDVVAFEEHRDYFRPEGDPMGANLDSYYPRPLVGSQKNIQTQSRYVQNAAYIRLKNLQIGYTLPEDLTKKILVEKVRVYVSGENLWTGTKLSTIFDPETIDGGWGGNAYPLMKVYSVGLNVNF